MTTSNDCLDEGELGVREGLSIEGLLRQTRRVLTGRWPWLLAVALAWGVVGLRAHDFAMQRMIDGFPTPDDPWLIIIPMLEGMVGVVGSAVMIGVVARTGRPRRPAGVMALHLVFAAATVALSLIVYGFGGMALQDAANRLAQAGGPLGILLGYVAAFVGPVYHFGLFVFLGMAMPAAMERLLSPWAAAAVSLRLTEGRRLWLAIIAVLWTVALLAPVYGVTLLAPMLSNTARPMLLVVQMLTALGIGVLYLELRRLGAAATSELAVDALA